MLSGFVLPTLTSNTQFVLASGRSPEEAWYTGDDGGDGHTTVILYDKEWAGQGPDHQVRILPSLDKYKIREKNVHNENGTALNNS